MDRKKSVINGDTARIACSPVRVRKPDLIHLSITLATSPNWQRRLTQTQEVGGSNPPVVTRKIKAQSSSGKDTRPSIWLRGLTAPPTAAPSLQPNDSSKLESFTLESIPAWVIFAYEAL
jgi:hypothetical protein